MSLNQSAVIPPQLADWALILGISVVTALLPNFLFAKAAPVVGPAKTAMAGSMELPTMFVIGWLAYGEPLGAVQITAGILVLLAVFVAPTMTESH